MNISILGICFTGDTGIIQHHNMGLVILSYTIAAAGSFAALEMIERWHKADGSRAFQWQLASSVTLGSSIWAMHFIGILALETGSSLTYALPPTVCSLLIAIGVVGLGLQIIRFRASSVRVGSAGVVVGLGIAAMHYIGMAAIRFPGSLKYTPGLWILSVFIGIVAAILALWLSIILHRTRQRAQGCSTLPLKAG